MNTLYKLHPLIRKVDYLKKAMKSKGVDFVILDEENIEKIKENKFLNKQRRFMKKVKVFGYRKDTIQSESSCSDNHCEHSEHDKEKNSDDEPD